MTPPQWIASLAILCYERSDGTFLFWTLSIRTYEDAP